MSGVVDIVFARSHSVPERHALADFGALRRCSTDPTRPQICIRAKIARAALRMLLDKFRHGLWPQDRGTMSQDCPELWGRHPEIMTMIARNYEMDIANLMTLR